MVQRHLAKLLPDASFDCISTEFNCPQLPTRHYLVKCTERGSHLPFLEKTSSSWISSCPGAPSPAAGPSSPGELLREPAGCAGQGGHSRSSPGSSGCQGASSLPFIPELPQECRGLPPSQHQLSCWISEAVFASSLCACVSAEGAVPQPRVICTISLYPSKSDRANNSSNLAE